MGLFSKKKNAGRFDNLTDPLSIVQVAKIEAQKYKNFLSGDKNRLITEFLKKCSDQASDPTYLLKEIVIIKKKINAFNIYENCMAKLQDRINAIMASKTIPEDLLGDIANIYFCYDKGNFNYNQKVIDLFNKHFGEKYINNTIKKYPQLINPTIIDAFSGRVTDAEMKETLLDVTSREVVQLCPALEEIKNKQDIAPLPFNPMSPFPNGGIPQPSGPTPQSFYPPPMPAPMPAPMPVPTNGGMNQQFYNNVDPVPSFASTRSDYSYGRTPTPYPSFTPYNNPANPPPPSFASTRSTTDDNSTSTLFPSFPNNNPSNPPPPSSASTRSTH